jgi:hypothetical protein
MVASTAAMAAVTPYSKVAAVALEVLINLPFHIIVSLAGNVPTIELTHR